MSARGEVTRARLLEAGLGLLGEAGWPALTARAVADRSGVNVGLIHYHFGGMSGLQEAVLATAMDAIIGDLHRSVAEAGDPRSMVEAVRDGLASDRDSARTARLSAVLLEGAARDPQIRTALRQVLRDARRQLSEHLIDGASYPPRQAAAFATLLMAASDGLLLHLAVDEELAAEEAVALLLQLV
ncbi:MAG: TetR/AcrR family transcriptional regulator [Nitriliruptoraceae bacterium]